MAETPTRDQNKFMVRMPDGLRDRLRELAEANKRSMNAEIVSRLEDSLDATAALDTTIASMDRLEAQIKAQEKRLDELAERLK